MAGLDDMPPLVDRPPPIVNNSAAFAKSPSAERRHRHHGRPRHTPRSASTSDVDWPRPQELAPPLVPSSYGPWPGPALGPGPYGGTPFITVASPSLAPSDSISAVPSMAVPAYAAYPAPAPWSPYDAGTYEPKTSESAFDRAVALHDPAAAPQPAYALSPWPAYASPLSSAGDLITSPGAALAAYFPASPGPPTPLPPQAGGPAPIPAYAAIPLFAPASSSSPYSSASSEAPVRHALDTVQASGLTDVADRRFFDRPGSWRPDFRMPRTGLDALFPGANKPKTISRAISEKGPYALNAKIRYAALRDPPVVYDLRQRPDGGTNAILFRDLRRPVTPYDLSSFATEPPVPLMRLYHPRLPWYLDVVARDPVGATLRDVFDTLFGFLHARITHSDFYNSDVSEDERAKISRTFRARCGPDAHALRRGVRRVDFLMRDCLFLGLSKGRDGMWEMRTRKL